VVEQFDRAELRRRRVLCDVSVDDPKLSWAASIRLGTGERGD
jgi:hypothetical protein